jgi:hypothetical protein
MDRARIKTVNSALLHGGSNGIIRRCASPLWGRPDGRLAMMTSPLKGQRPKFREASRSHASDSPCRANTWVSNTVANDRTGVRAGPQRSRERSVSGCERPGHRRTVPPVAVSGDLLGGGAGFELLVGYTRLGNLLGMLDREEIAEAQKHLVWVGRGA